MKQALMGKRTAIAATSLLTSIALLAGCGGKQQAAEPETKPEESNKPVTITVFNPSNYSEYLWENLWVNPTKKKYPHITLVNVKNEKGNSLAELVAANNVPDIIQGQGVRATFEYGDLGIIEDMTPMIKKHKIDLSHVEPAFMNSLKADPQDNSIYALPVTQNNAALFYNKNLFDRFGVAYPKDGMTWDEAYELARKMTRTDAGVKYRGLDIHPASLFNNNQMSLSFIDNKTNKAIVQTDGWKTFFTSLKRFYDIEGNSPPGSINNFLKDQNVAMFVVSNIFSPLIDATQAGLNWDLVTMPTYSSGPKTGIQPAVVGLFVSGRSQNKDEAFKVVANLVSDEVQQQRSKIGEPSVLKNSDIKKTFGSEMPHFNGRNFVAFVSSAPAPMPNSFTKYDAIGIAEMTRAFSELTQNKKDINTILREAEENINKAVEAQMKK